MVTQDELRHDRDERRWRAERLLADAALRRAEPLPDFECADPVARPRAAAGPIADPADVLLHSDEVDCPR